MKMNVWDAVTLREELETLILLSKKNAHRMSDSIRLSPVAEVLMREAVQRCDRDRAANHDD